MEEGEPGSFQTQQQETSSAQVRWRAQYGSHTGTGVLSALCMRCDLSGRGLRGEGGGRHREADPGDLPSL